MSVHQTHYRRETRWTQGAMADLPDAERIAETRRLLESMHGPVWNTPELARDFEVRCELGDIAYVKRRADGLHGSLFRHRGSGLWYDWRSAASRR